MILGAPKHSIANHSSDLPIYLHSKDKIDGTDGSKGSKGGFIYHDNFHNFGCFSLPQTAWPSGCVSGVIRFFSRERVSGLLTPLSALEQLAKIIGSQHSPHDGPFSAARGRHYLTL